MTIKRTARFAAYLLIAALAAWAAYFVIAGVPYTFYAAVPPGQPLGPAQTVYMPYYPALYSPLVLLLVIVGLIRDRWLPLAWVGLLMHLAIGVLLIFSLGILYIGVTGVLVALVSLIEWQATGWARWLLAAGAGAALLLLIGVVMLGTSYGYPLLAAGLILCGLVIVLWTWGLKEKQRMLWEGLMAPRIRFPALTLLFSFVALALIGCTPAATPAPTAGPTPTYPSLQRLRVRNAGTTLIKGLVVGFAVDNIAFGDVSPGATTDYQTVPHGVLRYAAYRFQMDGRETGQAVIDFIGEQPLPGSAFTYSVDYDSGRFSHNEAIRLIGVITDK